MFSVLSNGFSAGLVFGVSPGGSYLAVGTSNARFLAGATYFNGLLFMMCALPGNLASPLLINLDSQGTKILNKPPQPSSSNLLVKLSILVSAISSRTPSLICKFISNALPLVLSVIHCWLPDRTAKSRQGEWQGTVQPFCPLAEKQESRILERRSG